MAGRTVLLDTSFIVALENRDDPCYERARELDRELLATNAVLLLHWGIVLEIGDGYARLGRRMKGVELLRQLYHEEGYHLVPITEPLISSAISLYSDRLDKDWGLTDCLSFVVMRQHGITEALTADRHFEQAGFQALLL